VILHQSCFNVIHHESLIKVDFMIRKREDYRLHEFERRQRIEIAGRPLWIVSKEDLILWARRPRFLKRQECRFSLLGASQQAASWSQA
jgi:hypothetical protein